MPTPSEKAKQLVQDIHEAGDYDAAFLIDTALNEARLEGVKLGLEAAAQDLEANHLRLNDDGTFEWHTEKDALSGSKMAAKKLHAERLRTLDPQQVTNERMGA
jgi:hypothetical protein